MKNNLITVVTFCALIGGLTVASIVNPTRAYSETENRNLQQMPEFSLESLFDGEFTADYETFITDQFVLRDKWIALKTQAELALGKKDSGGVYFGKDGYLIEKHEYDEEQLEYNINALNSFISLTKEKYNVSAMIAPTASLILADKLPTFAPVWDQAGMLDRLAQNDAFVDARDILSEHSGENIYYRTDHHWTTLGAYYAYVELCGSLGIEPLEEASLEREILSSEFIGTLAAKVNTKNDFEEIFTYVTDVKLSVDYNMGHTTSDSVIDRTYLEKRDKYGAFLSGNQPISDITTSNKNGKTLLVIKDSYSHCMVPLLVNHYERIILLDLRHFNMGVMSYIASVEADGGSIDDIVVLYNAENFTEDRYLVKLAK